MELKHLQTFSTAAELSSFTRAAEQLELTQAAVSQQIASLERELDVKLFERTGRRVTISDAGRLLYDYARRILDLADEAARAVGAAGQAVRGTLRIAASTVPAESLLPELLAGFRGKHPDVVASVTISDSEAAALAVQNGDADLGLVGELPRSSSLAALPVSTDELILVVSPKHPLAASKSVSLKKLRAQPLIVRESGSGSRHCVEAALAAAGLPAADLTVAMEINSNEAIRAAVSRGTGAAFLSAGTVEQDIKTGRLAKLKITGVRIKRQLYLVTDPQRIPGPAARAFLTHAGEN